MKSSKKILGASAALGLAVALSAGSTFAWFTVGSTQVKVNEFNVDVAATTSDSLEISVVGAAQQSGKPETAAVGVTPSGFASVGSYTVPTGTTIELAPASWDGSNFVGEQTTDTIAQNAVYTFRIGFKSNVAMKIYLDASEEEGVAKSSVLPGELPANKSLLPVSVLKSVYGLVGENGQAGAGSIIKNLDDKFYGDYSAGAVKNDNGDYQLTSRAAYASRVMFRAVEYKDSVDQYKADGTKIWCPNEANYDGSDLYKGDGASEYSLQNKHAAGFYAQNLAGAYAYLLAQSKETDPNFNLTSAASSGDITEAQSYTNSVIPWEGKMQTSDTTKADYTDCTVIATTASSGVLSGYSSTAGFYAVVDVTVWLEGTDGDCFNAVATDIMKVLLSFRGEKVTG